MFLKKYRIKSSTVLKGSDRKKLRNSIRSAFTSLSEEDLNSLLPPKGELTQVKAFTHSGETVLIYCRDNNPLFFSLENLIFPTVYTLWKFSSIIPTLTTLPPVLPKICNGADLMAPGIVVGEKTVDAFRDLQINQICSVRIIGNLMPVAVGVAAMSDSDILVEGCKGKAVFIKHCYKDNLWLQGDQSHLPLVADDCLDSFILNQEDDDSADDNMPHSDDIDEIINQNLSELQITENENIVEEPKLDNAATNLAASENLGNITEDDDNENCNAENNTAPEYTMDDILKECFFFGLKVHGKKIELPVLTSTFYRTYVLSCCPKDLSLDIKKTSYKKFSAFLKEMVSQKLVEVKELTKGVESIVTINLDNEKVKEFFPDPRFKEHMKKQKEATSSSQDSSKDVVQDNYKFPEVVEMFAVSAQVKTLFEKMNIRKGDALISGEIREIVRDYVKQHNLIDEKNPRLVLLDPVLADALLKKGENKTAMTWEELHEGLLQRMSPAHKVMFDGEEAKVKKGLLEPIEVTIATRTGNKKVTLISNLENFGIKPEKLANYVQVAVAASTSVGQASSGKKGTQVLIQGNQLKYLQKLFFEVYKVPRKYVKGLDSIPAKKKK